MRKFLIILSVLFLFNTTYATLTLDDFSLSVYKKGYLYQGTFNDLESCINRKKLKESNSNYINTIRSDCFQLELNSKYYYFICRNSNSCNKNTILKEIGFKEIINNSNNTLNNSFKSNNSNNTYNIDIKNIDLSKYSDLSNTLINKIITIGDKLILKYSDKPDYIQSLELGFYDYKLDLYRKKYIGDESKSKIISVIDLFKDILLIKINEINNDLYETNFDSDVNDLFGNLFSDGENLDNESDIISNELDLYLGRKIETYKRSDSKIKLYSNFINYYSNINNSIKYKILELIKTKYGKYLNPVNGGCKEGTIITKDNFGKVISCYSLGFNTGDNLSNALNISNDSNNSEDSFNSTNKPIINKDFKIYKDISYKGLPLWIGRDSYALEWCKENYNENTTEVYRSYLYHQSNNKPYYYYLGGKSYIYSKGSSLGAINDYIVCGIGYTKDELKNFISENNGDVDEKVEEGGYEKVIYSISEIKGKIGGLIMDNKLTADNFCKKYGNERVKTFKSGNTNDDRYEVYVGGKISKYNSNCSEFKCITEIICEKKIEEKPIKISKSYKVYKDISYKGLPLWIGRDSYALEWCKENYNENTTEVYRSYRFHVIDNKPNYYYLGGKSYNYHDGSSLGGFIDYIVCGIGYTKDELKNFISGNNGDVEEKVEEGEYEKVIYSMSEIKGKIGGLIMNNKLTADNFCKKYGNERVKTFKSGNTNDDRYEVYVGGKISKYNSNCSEFKCITEIICEKKIEEKPIKISKSYKVYKDISYKGLPLWIGRDSYALEWCKENYNENTTEVYRSYLYHQSNNKPYYYYLGGKSYTYSKGSSLGAINDYIVCGIGYTKDDLKAFKIKNNKISYITLQNVYEIDSGVKNKGNTYICSRSTGKCIVDGGSKNGVVSSWFSINGDWLNISGKDKKWSLNYTEYCGYTKGPYGPMKSGVDVQFNIKCSK